MIPLDPKSDGRFGQTLATYIQTIQFFIFGLQIKNEPFLVKLNGLFREIIEQICYSKYCPSDAMACPNNSGNLQISSRKNNGTFDRLEKLIYFLTF